MRSTGLTGRKPRLDEVMHEHFVNGEWHPTDLFLLEELREGDIADTSTSLKLFPFSCWLLSIPGQISTW